MNLDFTETSTRLPLDGSDPDEEHPVCGYLVVNDLGSVYQMSYSKLEGRFYHDLDNTIEIDMKLAVAWAPLGRKFFK